MEPCGHLSKTVAVHCCRPDLKKNARRNKMPKYCDEGTNSTPENPSTPSILSLNDDCLMHIFSYFPVITLLKIENVCKRWRSLIAPMWSHCHSLQVSFVDNSPNSHCVDLSDILNRCGAYIGHITLQLVHLHVSEQKNVFQLLNTQCERLETLHITDMKLGKWKNMKQLSSLVPKLHGITFDDCSFDGSTLNRLLECCKNLEVLEFMNFDEEITISSDKLPKSCHTLLFKNFWLDLVGDNACQVTKMTMTMHSMSVSYDFDSFDTSLVLAKANDWFPNLKDLTLLNETPGMCFEPLFEGRPGVVFEKITHLSFYMFCPSDADLDCMTDMFPNLKSLRFHGDNHGNFIMDQANVMYVTPNGLKRLAKLKNLEELLCPMTIDSISTWSEPIEDFAKAIAPRLRSFEYHHSSLNPYGILKLVELNPSLCFLSIREFSDADMSPEEFVMRLTNILKYRTSWIKLDMVTGAELPESKHPLLTIKKGKFGNVIFERYGGFWAHHPLSYQDSNPSDDDYGFSDYDDYYEDYNDSFEDTDDEMYPGFFGHYYGND